MDPPRLRVVCSSHLCYLRLLFLCVAEQGDDRTTTNCAADLDFALLGLMSLPKAPKTQSGSLYPLGSFTQRFCCKGFALGQIMTVTLVVWAPLLDRRYW